MSAGLPRLEVEAKAHAKDLKAVEATLAKIGAVLEANKVERDEYWAHPARNFAETDEALRLRVTTADDGGGWSGADLTYKGPKLDAVTKSRREDKVDFAVDAVPGMRRVLEGLGFKPVATVTKERKEFIADGLTVCLDRVEGVGDFVEVEHVSHDLEASRARVLALFARLGLDPSERRSYLEMKLRGVKGH
jgi:adenylate cyclase class 2